MNNQEPTKVCSRCQVEKPIGEFNKRKDRNKDSHRADCKTCERQYKRKHYLKHKDEILLHNKKYRDKNPEKIKLGKIKSHIKYKEEDNLRKRKHHSEHKEEDNLRSRQYNLEHKQEISLQRKQHHLEHKEEDKLRHKIWRSAHKEKIRIKHKEDRLKNKIHIRNQQRQYINHKLKTDMCFKTISLCRKMVRRALNGNPKSEHTMTYFMCSIDEFKTHIERLWLPGMNWENRGTGPSKWQIDHIIPCSFFKDYISDEVEKYMCCRWQNLQPLWWEDNMAKGVKII